MTATGVTPALSTVLHLSLPILKFLSLPQALISASRNIVEFSVLAANIAVPHEQPIDPRNRSLP
uniref:hypothetical protein n=1 Tax=Mycobacterium sp. HUMS_1102779 TaxID=3383487 RepID=UPI00389A6C18